MNDEKPTDRTPWATPPAAPAPHATPADATPASAAEAKPSIRPTDETPAPDATPASAAEAKPGIRPADETPAPPSDSRLWVRPADEAPAPGAASELEPPADGPATGAVALLAKTFYAPGEAFEEVARRRRSPLLPLLLLMALALVAAIALISRSDFSVSMEEQMKSNPRLAQMDDAQRAQAIAVGATFAKVISVFSPVFVLIGITLVSAVFWVCLLIGGNGPRFPDVFRVVCWGQGPALLGSLAFIAVALFSGGAVDLNNPVASNLGALLDPATAAKPLVALFKSLDVFMIWALVLYAIGLAKTARGALAGKLALVFGLYAALIVVKVGLAAIF
ncbi:MAG: YIP1 family protein [Candidatus Polarisedimenticolia bacterium]